MLSSRRTWMFFLLGSLVLVVVVALVSWRVMEDDRAQAQVRAEAEHRELERAALWRLDGVLSSLIVAQSGRAIALDLKGGLPDPEAFGGFLEPARSFFLLFFRSDDVNHFVSCDAGRVLSKEDRALLSSLHLAEVKRRCLKDSGASWSARSTLVAGPGEKEVAGDVGDLASRNMLQQFGSAANAISNALAIDVSPSSLLPFRGYWTSGPHGDVLLLARPTSQRDVVQYLLVDWPSLSAWLSEQVRDLLPGAEFRPYRGSSADSGAALLSELPLRLVSRPRDASFFRRDMTTFLAIVWGAVLAALGCIAMVLNFSMGLSRRRSRFVSTVTHELRTPMTTFKLYAQMLADGMVPSEEKRASYLQTLKEESERLSRVLESVLAYSRLENRDARRTFQAHSVADILNRLEAAVQRFGNEAEIAIPFTGASHQGAAVVVDPAMVDQILANLLENAIRHGCPPISVHAGVDGGAFFLDVVDQGEGVSESERARIFEEFHRSEGARDRGGLGLGLFWARSLARTMKGNLVLKKTTGRGAAFRLSLPLKH